jgi:DNA-directed RNA polymerase specialized sigma24 family protein
LVSVVADTGNFEEWYPETHRRLVVTLTVFGGGLDEATEAADEALVRAYERWDRVRTLDSPTAWTYRVAVNVLKRRARRRSVEASILRNRLPLPSIPPPAGEAWELVKDLTPRQRLAVVLRYVADLPEAEIAAAMGVSRSTVSSTLADALTRLRVTLTAGMTEVPHA